MLASLVLLHLFDILKISRAIDGIIWSRSKQNFVPLYSVPSFLIAKNDYLMKCSGCRESREMIVNAQYGLLKSDSSVENHNFQKAVLTAAYFQESNIVSFIDDDTKITGACGDIWNTLADYLNFTLIPIKVDRNFGTEFPDGSFDGILGLVQQNLSQIIPRSGVFKKNMQIVEYTMPLWTVRYHLYIKPKWEHDEAWMIHLFQEELWYSYLLLLLILSIAGYVYEKYSKSSTDTEETHFNLQDHILYTVAIASTQGCVPDGYSDKFRIIYLFTSIFSWLILIAFNSHAIYLMMNKQSVLPFVGLKGLIQHSKYNVMAFNGSMVHQEFEELVSKYFRNDRDMERVTYIDTAHELYETICFDNKKKMAGFEAEDRHKAIGRHICRLIPTRAAYFETWIASAIKRGFPYKRSFDVGILKLAEAGIVDGLRDRWLDWKQSDNQDVPFQSIDMSQVYFIFGILYVGVIASICILMIEYFIFFINKVVNGSSKRLRKQTKKSRVFIRNNAHTKNQNKILFTFRS